MENILIVDDEKSIRITMKAFLSQAGYRVKIAENVEQGLEMLQEEAFDVILTDIILPRFSGLELLKSIKSASPRVQVIMMTGEPTVETAAQSQHLGAFDYLVKPVTKEMLLAAVAKAVDGLQKLDV